MINIRSENIKKLPGVFGKQLHIKVTEYCNANCSFCGYNRTKFKSKIVNGYKPAVLEVDTFYEKFSELKKQGFAKLHLTGGEPFMHPMLMEFISLAKKAGFSVQTGTNGSLIDEQTAKFLHDIKVDYLWLSLDTFPIEKHLQHRGFLKIKHKFINGISLLQKYRVNFFGQTVISHLLPKKNGRLDLEGHVDYYKNNFGINRFLFSYPMHRPNSDNGHLAATDSANIDFSIEELTGIYNSLIELKQRRKNVQIINPLVSLWNQIQELKRTENYFGCYAGRDIFFLGKDEISLHPCYYFSDQIVGKINDNSFKNNKNYESCTACQDECFRDSSIIYAIKHHPLRMMKNLISDKQLFQYALSDIRDIIKNGMYRNA